MAMPDSTLPAFSLADSRGQSRSFPTGRPALLCFVKEDCPTCGITMPLIEAACRGFGAAVDVLAIGQDAPGNAALVERHKLPILDDTALNVSYAYAIETVPTIIVADAKGAESR